MEDRREGFTFVEVLISIVILSVVVGFSAILFRVYIGQVRKMVSPYPEFAVNFSFLRDSIKGIFLYVDEDSTGGEKFHYHFRGDNHSFEFISNRFLVDKGLFLLKLYQDNETVYLKAISLYSPYCDYKLPKFNEKFTRVFKLFDNVSELNINYIIDGRKTLSISNEIPASIELSFDRNGEKYHFFFDVESDFNKLKFTKSMIVSGL